MKEFAIMASFIVLIVTIGVIHAMNYEKPSVKSHETVMMENRELELYDLTNKQRDRTLTLDVCLVSAARDRAEYIVENEHFEHTAVDSEDMPYTEMVRGCGDFRYAGENLAINFTDMQRAIEKLMDSPNHRRNIVNKVYTEVGVGCYKQVCVQIFRGK